MRSARRWTGGAALLGLALASAGPAVRAQTPNAAGPPDPVPLAWSPRERIEQSLARSRTLAGTRIRAEGESAELTLTGVVATPAQRDRALWIAARAAPTERVEDRLRVDPSLAPPVARADGEIAKEIAELLVAVLIPEAEAKGTLTQGWRVEGQGWALEVDVDDGDVTLSGTALLAQHVHRAILAARDVRGVRSVRSEAELRPNPISEDPVHSS